jgi:hypothetical protein
MAAQDRLPLSARQEPRGIPGIRHAGHVSKRCPVPSHTKELARGAVMRLPIADLHTRMNLMSENRWLHKKRPLRPPCWEYWVALLE